MTPRDSNRDTFAERKFLGEPAKAWAGWILKGAVVVGASLFAWYMWVNESLADRPTYEEASEMLIETIEAHEDHGSHGKLEQIIQQNAKQLDALSDIQIRQTVILEAQGKDIEDVERAVDRERRRRR